MSVLFAGRSIHEIPFGLGSFGDCFDRLDLAGHGSKNRHRDWQTFGAAVSVCQLTCSCVCFPLIGLLLLLLQAGVQFNQMDQPLDNV